MLPHREWVSSHFKIVVVSIVYYAPCLRILGGLSSRRGQGGSGAPVRVRNSVLVVKGAFHVQIVVEHAAGLQRALVVKSNRWVKGVRLFSFRTTFVDWKFTDANLTK